MKLVKQAVHFAFGTLISRILGFFRDAGIAYYFGSSYITDAFFVAFRIPNSLRRLIGEGGFNASFVPIYTKAVEEGKEKEFLSSVFTFYTLINLLIAVCGILFAEWIIKLLAPGLIKNTETYELAVLMLKLLFPYVFFIGLYAFFMGILNVHGNFFIPAFAQGVFNAVFLLSLILFSEKLNELSLIAGVILGVIFQVLIHVPFLIKERISFKISFKILPETKLLFKRLVPAIGGFGVNQLSIFVDTFLASLIGPKTISYLYYANRIFQLPFGIISVGVANSLLSVLSRKGVNKKEEMTNAIILVLTLTVPACTGMFILSEEIINVIYRRGEFSSQDALITSEVLKIYSLGLISFSLYKVLTAEILSRGDTKTPVKISLITIISEGILAYVFAFIFNFGIYGLPLGNFLSSFTGLLLTAVHIKEGVFLKRILKSAIKILVATAIMSLPVLFIKISSDNDILKVLLSVSFGILSYFLSLFLLGETLLLKGFIKKFIKS